MSKTLTIRACGFELNAAQHARAIRLLAEVLEARPELGSEAELTFEREEDEWTYTANFVIGGAVHPTYTVTGELPRIRLAALWAPPSADPVLDRLEELQAHDKLAQTILGALLDEGVGVELPLAARKHWA